MHYSPKSGKGMSTVAPWLHRGRQARSRGPRSVRSHQADQASASGIAVPRGRGEHGGLVDPHPRSRDNSATKTKGSNRWDATMACGRKSSMSMLYLAEAGKEPKRPPSWVHQRNIITRPGTSGPRLTLNAEPEARCLLCT